MKQKKCRQCQINFTCGPEEGKDHCWCSDLPHVGFISDGGDCLCQKCLSEFIKNNPDRILVPKAKYKDQ